MKKKHKGNNVMATVFFQHDAFFHIFGPLSNFKEVDF
jgi:hypothetical protein